VDYEGFKDLASQSFDEFLEQPLVQDLKKSFSLDNEMLQSLWNMRPTLEGITRDFEDIGKALTGQDDQTSMLDTVEDTLASAGTAIAREFGGVKQAAASTLIEDEGFSSTQYDDMGQPSVGHGLQVASLEPDERALIKDINNVQEDESKAVVQLKVEKTANYFSETVEGFENLPASAQSSMIQMGYQLGRFNVTKEWPKFMEAVKEATTYAEGSAEQLAALGKAKFNMLYNMAEDGTITATKWATQTTDRAMKVAEGMVTDAKAAGAGIVEAVSEAVIPSAEASTITPANVGEQPKGEDVLALAKSPDFISAALKYMGIDERSKEGAKMVEGMFNAIVGGKAFKGTPEEVAKANAWCAAFIATVLADAGIDANKLMGTTDKYAATRTKNYLKIGKPVDVANAQAGDIMIKVHTKAERDEYFKDTGEKLQAFGHAGIVVRSEDGELYFVGGNTGDKVKFSSYSHDKDLRIRRIDGVTKPDVDNLPSIREMKWGVAGTAVDKLETAWTSMIDFFN